MSLTKKSRGGPKAQGEGSALSKWIESSFAVTQGRCQIKVSKQKMEGDFGGKM